LSEGLPFVWSIGNEAGMVVAVTEDPGFADRAVSRQRSGENAGQAPAAPEPVLVDRFESQGI
jgi:hypothetical protein